MAYSSGWGYTGYLLDADNPNIVTSPKSSWAPITNTVDDASWKTPEQLVAERSNSPVHEPIHGRIIPIFRGAYKRKGDLFWATPVEKRTITTNSSGKGGGGGDDDSGGESPTKLMADFAVGFGRNEFQNALTLLEVLADETVIFDVTSGTATFSGMTMRAYDGINNEVEPVMLARDGASKTPAYHGYVYLFFEDFDCEAFGGRIPIITARVSDAVTTASGEYTITSIAVAPDNGITGNSFQSFDVSLNRFYVWYENANVGTEVHLETIDFDSRTATSIVQVSDSVKDVFASCAIPGTGYILSSGEIVGQVGTRDLLIDTESGNLLASSFDSADEVVEWQTALPLFGGAETTYIAAGYIAQSNATPNLDVAFVAVNVTTPSITYLLYGSNRFTDASTTYVTPGAAGVDGTTFYVGQEGVPGTEIATVYEIKFTDTDSPTIRQVYEFDIGPPLFNGITINGIYYDESLDRLLVSYADLGPRYAAGIDASDGTVVFTTSFGSGTDNDYNAIPGGGAWDTQDRHSVVKLTARLLPGYAVLHNNNTDVRILMNMQDGSFTNLGTVNGSAIHHFDQHTGTAYNWGSGPWTAVASGRYTVSDIPIAEVLTDFAVYAGYTEAQVATSGLSGLTCKGLYIANDATIQDLANRVSELYSIDIVESGDTIKFIRKGTDDSYAADVTLTADDLVEVPVDDATSHIQSTRQYENDMLAEVEVQYIDIDADFQPQNQIAQRPNGVLDVTSSERKETISVPLVLDADNAKQRAIEVLYRWVAAQNSHRLILPAENIALEPSDIMEVTADGVTRRLKVRRTTARPDYASELELLEFLSETATNVVGGIGIIHADQRRTLTAQPSRYFHLDVPLLRYQHDTSGASLVQYHVITSRGLPSWSGGSVYRRAASGTWQKVHTLSGVHPTVAVCLTALGAPTVDWSTDYENTVHLRVIGGTSADIDTETYEDVMNGANVAAIGRPGRWEIIQWITATANADGTITISEIVRGQRGTEVYGSTHQVGDYFVVLKQEFVKELFYDTGDLDDSYSFRAVGAFQNPSIVAIEKHAISGAAETPYAPCHINVVRSGDDFVITWDRRTRLSAPWKDDGSSTEAPLGETSKLYDIEIMDASGGSPDPIVLRTYSNVTTETKTYPQADIQADWGTIGSPAETNYPSQLTVRLYQRSEIIGRGHQAEATIIL